jgi:hypothetical protein
MISGLAVFLGTRRIGFADQRREFSRVLGGAVKLEMQGRHGVDLQSLEQTIAQKSGRFIQAGRAFSRVADQHRKVDLGMGVVGRDLHVVDRDHANAGVFEVADQLAQIALDLVGNADAAVGYGSLVAHGVLWVGRTSANPAFFGIAGFAGEGNSAPAAGPSQGWERPARAGAQRLGAKVTAFGRLP